MVGATGFEPATSCSRSRRATKLRYAPSLVPILRFPRVLPDQLHEDAARVLADVQLAARLVDDPEALCLLAAHGHDEPSALRELLEKRGRHRWPARRHQDAIERRLVGPSHRPVGGPYPHVAHADRLERLPSARGEPGDPLYGAHTRRHAREHGGLIPAAGSDLEHLL